jgi:hypothetical protein
MNIFVLDEDPRLAAEYHCNKHVVKMILESAQMLCSAHWYSLLNEHEKKLTDFKGARKAKEWLFSNSHPSKIPPYSFTHIYHPCTVWTSKCVGNYNWHVSLMRALLDEYTVRYGKKHKCEDAWKWLHDNEPSHISSSKCVTEHPQAMPEDCKVPGSSVQAYRNYYSNHKRRFAKWEPRAKTPHWF